MKLTDITLELQAGDCWGTPKTTTLPQPKGEPTYWLTQSRLDFKGSVTVTADISEAMSI